MDISTLLTLTKDLANTSNVNLWGNDTKMLLYLNIAYHDMEARIRQMNEDYFRDIFTDNLVADQYEYVLPVHNATTVWIGKINRVELKYDNEGDEFSYVRAVPGSLSSIYDSLEYYKENKSGARPMYEKKEWSVFIYPVPSENVTDGIKIHGTKLLIDLAASGAETTIFPNHPELRQYHYIIAMGAIGFIERVRNKNDKSLIAQSRIDYKSAVEDMITQLWSTYDEALVWEEWSCEEFY